ncbi:SDR family oxidoreductase [Noviherbaspirillum pedocola]|uniref:SDR family oxidoreductase n=1 Tax=Noviherbaspirillum pedocola TaxID=2801341 RepID=A0A934SZ87_9BURK|nr:SDR family oxidoreductase [Noviherbaspirillum pedocola]MBK4737736.1 SDR family oxidoreductase [Noviherbaspirillum pedocola]
MKKAVLVTGSGRGIGAAVARLASRQGYAVAVNYVSDAAAAKAVVDEIRAQGGDACLVQGDVGSEDEVKRLFAEAEAALGPLYGVINNAGITGRIGKFVAADPEAIERIFRVNVLGTMHCCRAALRSFAASGTRGAIVNVSSIAAITGSPNEYVHYAASKSAIDVFTLGLAREVAPDGIRVCGVAPGMTLTDIHAAAGEPGRPARVVSRIPQGRLASPEEIAEPIVWLLSDAASYMTGAMLRCSGGV